MLLVHWDAGLNTAACRDTKGALVTCSALEFLGWRNQSPGRYCAVCFVQAEKVVNSTPRTDSDRYAELRALVEAWQSHQAGSSTALAEWRHR